ncbi:MAG TPA: response regulator [Mycobacteriales bacterium]|jgi:two-component system KDP operon response regulator KdpE|nr:response regulator [Mycobacteriales bacterium]
MTSVLVVDDEPQIVRALRVNLQARGYDVLVALTGKQALEMTAHHHPDLVILDLGLPDIDGVDVVRGLRGWTTVPILILSGRDHSVAKVTALDAGADDYVTKPFNVDELLARLRAISRRTGDDAAEPVVRVGDYDVDLQAKRVSAVGGAEPAGEDVRLTPTEWQLLEALVRHPGRLMTQRELIRTIRGPTYDDAAHYLRQYMNQLRRKLEPDPTRPRYLLTEPGMGYRFQP